MKRVFYVISSFLVAFMITFVANFSVCDARELTDEEKAAFITREEFEEWRDAFIASLSELDLKSTNKIYDNMNFYDMQFKITDTYKREEYYDEDNKQNTDLLNEMIMEEKAKRGLL